ncbi:helicase domain-containing protein : DNA methylase OS=Synechococcus phage S-CBS3 GN=S-CBS3_gp40 PE=4 SV=1: N6_N4_Mtase [Gemmataceae bacterium]|nr:helicase domain-containing protein : DNA methylase OS=Synechococcus phage S-CBS3 GN=S-CBS3_gp40 PE=4 SV=1: N6_N4_Mtase [Gemmataceae bacterium]VTT98909.1 helicase domain-containing protein : DNA methylase OS=Synechococcus phage S-CBS3 GN=S-CBS3_gp40 PE=4 SV=1: N6_N4_Mtase [Gemmataceae bacterium]
MLTATDTEYLSFIASKARAAEPAGFDCDPAWLPAAMKGHQHEVALWALKLGRAAAFLERGLGKTLVSLGWGGAVARHTGRPVLYLCPLAVGPQTVREAAKFGVPGVALAASQGDVTGPGVWVTNYQKLHKFDPAAFGGVILGESSILKNFTGRTKRDLCAAFAATPFRLCETATPAPNDHMELGNHSEFLGVMPANEMLTRWFINDLAHAGEYRLKGHAAADYWRWVASWACCLSKPSDLGYDDAGYDLPPLRVFEHVVKGDLSAADALVNNQKLSASRMHAEMRKTAADRAAEVARLVAAEPDRAWLIWCNTDYEADALVAVVPGCVEVRGSHKDAVKEDRLTGFSEGRYLKLASKPSLCGHGMNWQHCSRMAFMGLSYSWEQYHQALGRCWRYGQTEEVHAHVVCAETELEVLADIKRKQADAERMRSAMVGAVREAWRGEHRGRTLVTSYDATRVAGDGWELRLGDSCQEVKAVPDDSVDFTIFSPPFSNLYIYSDSAFDMGNAAGDEEFFAHFRFLIPELLRVTVPGRLCAVHCKDLPLYRNRDDASGLQDFPAEISKAFTAAGWIFHSRVTIWKCPVTERERTNSHGLLHQTVMGDSTRVRQGMADYLLVFRKNPPDGTKSAKPVARPKGFEDWPGDPDLDPRANPLHPSKFARKPGRKPRQVEVAGEAVDLTPSVNIWQRLADPVWFHVDQREVLNNYKEGTGDRDDKHICPLQLGVVREAVYLWTNPGDLVFSPFAGVGSEGYESLKLGRRFLGIELKKSYLDVAAANLTRAAKIAKRDAAPNLFTGLE